MMSHWLLLSFWYLRAINSRDSQLQTYLFQLLIILCLYILTVHNQTYLPCLSVPLEHFCQLFLNIWHNDVNPNPTFAVSKMGFLLHLPCRKELKWHPLVFFSLCSSHQTLCECHSKPNNQSITVTWHSISPQNQEKQERPSSQTMFRNEALLPTGTMQTGCCSKGRKENTSSSWPMPT